MPDDVALEKSRELEMRGAEVCKVRPVNISHPEHMVNLARAHAQATDGAFFADQFENRANMAAHIKTGEEIWQQTNGRVDAFVCGAGTTLTAIATAAPYL
jgi:cysteine synthase